MRPILLFVAAAQACAIALPPGSDIPLVNVNPATATVSGISSGAFMAVQMHVAFSTFYMGAGVLAGGPFWCAQDDVEVALTSCMTSGQDIDLDFLYGIMENTALYGFVDPLEGLAHSRVWLLSAMNDTVVSTSVVQKNQALYSRFLSSPATQLKAVYNRQGEHAQLTTSYGSTCTFLGEPYINNCGFDAAGDMLQWLYNGSLTPPNENNGKIICKISQNFAQKISTETLPECENTVSAPPASRPVLRGASGSVYSFDQGLFVGGGGWDTMFGLAQTAFVYIPDVCLKNCTNCTPSVVCTLHVAFHGCLQTQDQIGTLFVTEGGYLPWADANNMVVLFPQAISNELNPKGCFDWWGYAGSEYASNIGTQTLAVKGMSDVLVGAPITPNRTVVDAAAFAKYQQVKTQLMAESRR